MEKRQSIRGLSHGIKEIVSALAPYRPVADAAALFAGVSPQELGEMLACLGAEVRRAEKNEIVLLAGSRPEQIGLVLSGNGQQTGLMDAQGRDVFVNSFPYLRDLKLDGATVYADI